MSKAVSYNGNNRYQHDEGKWGSCRRETKEGRGCAPSSRSCPLGLCAIRRCVPLLFAHSAPKSYTGLRKGPPSVRARPTRSVCYRPALRSARPLVSRKRGHEYGRLSAVYTPLPSARLPVCVWLFFHSSVNVANGAHAENEGKRGQTGRERRMEVVRANKAGVRGVAWQRGSGVCERSLHPISFCTHLRSHAVFACPEGMGVVRTWKREEGRREDGAVRRVVYALFTSGLPVA